MWWFFVNDTATTEIYTLSLHDALPISAVQGQDPRALGRPGPAGHLLLVGGRLRQQVHPRRAGGRPQQRRRSEEHTSELQSRQYLVCRLLLEKKTQYDSSVHASTAFFYR